MANFFNKQRAKPKCHFCQGDHAIYYCKNFVELLISQRAAEIHSRKLCVNCLHSSSHASSKCTLMPRSARRSIMRYFCPQERSHGLTIPIRKLRLRQFLSPSDSCFRILQQRTSHAFDCGCTRLRQQWFAQSVPSFVGLRIELRIQEICGSSRFKLNVSISGDQRHSNHVQSRG